MGLFDNDKPKYVEPPEDPEVARLKKEEAERTAKEKAKSDEERSAKARGLRGARSLMSGGYKGYDEEDNLGSA